LAARPPGTGDDPRPEDLVAAVPPEAVEAPSGLGIVPAAEVASPITGGS
jgi:hypothetical protein